MAASKAAKKATSGLTELVKKGGEAYALAVLHRAVVEPRLTPAGMIDALAEDLTALGAPPAAAAAPAAGPAAAVVPALALGDALAKAVVLMTAAHEAVSAGKAKGEVRKAYGVGEGGAGKDVARVIVALGKAAARAEAQPGEALGFGIVGADVTAMKGALADLKAAEAGRAVAAAGVTGKLRKAAEGRIRTAVERITGAGVMGFAQDAGVRGAFEGLRKKG